MTKRQIRLLLKLENELTKELKIIYTACILDMCPVLDIRDMPMPARRKIISSVQKHCIELYPELSNSSVFSAIVSNYVSQKYKVKK